MSRRLLLAAAIGFAAVACVNETAAPPTTTPPPTALADLADDVAGYELVVGSLGTPERRRLAEPIPVGREGQVEVTIESSDELISVLLDVVVTRAAADGSSQTVEVRIAETSAGDTDLAVGLQQVVGASAVAERDALGAVLTLSVDVPDQIGIRADAVARQALVAPFMLASPLPGEAVGQGADWLLTTRTDTGEITSRNYVVDALSPGEHTISVALDGGAGEIVGGPGDLFPAKQTLTAGDTVLTAVFRPTN